MPSIPFCIARVGHPVETVDGCDVHFVDYELPNTESVFELLRSTHNRFATQIADRNAELRSDERTDLSTIGGFGVQLTNRFGGVIEVAWGSRFSLLIRLAPQPTKTYRGSLDKTGTLIFFLDGWHHTEMDVSDLVSRDDCLLILCNWLETNVLPDTT